jgi:hypothetical protein
MLAKKPGQHWQQPHKPNIIKDRVNERSHRAIICKIGHFNKAGKWPLLMLQQYLHHHHPHQLNSMVKI